MKRKLNNVGERPKAFWGALVSTGLSLAGNVIGSIAQKKQQQNAAKRQQEEELYQQQFNLLNNDANITGQNNAAQNAYDLTNRVIFKKGGKRKLRNAIYITDGGYAIPVGNNTFLLQGSSHEDINETGQTGIGLNIGGKEIEAEGGEVVQRKGNEVRIFSRRPMLNGISPSEAVLEGANKNEVFNAQENIKRDKASCGMRRKLKFGGFSSPVGRIKAAGGFRAWLDNKRRENPNYTYNDAVSDYQRESAAYDFDRDEEGYKDFINSLGNIDKSNAITDDFVSNIAPRTNSYASFYDIPTETNDEPRSYFSIANDEGTLAANEVYPRKTPITSTINTNNNNGDSSLDSLPDFRLYGADWANLGVNVLGSGLVNYIRHNTLNNLKRYAPTRPISLSAGKLNTMVDYNPQRSAIAYARQRGFDNLRRGTASSSALLSRLSDLNYRTTQAENEIINQGEAQRRELINRDILNQQEVNNRNIATYNDWVNRRAAYLANIEQEKGNATVDMIKGIGGAASDLIQAGLDNAADIQDRAYLAAASATGTPETLDERARYLVNLYAPRKSNRRRLRDSYYY